MAGFGQIIGLIVLLAVVAGAGFIGYHLYLWSNELAERGRKKLEKKHLSFTKDGGLRVEVNQMSDEVYADKTQHVLVNTWNNAALPNYKSRLGWNSTQADPKKARANDATLKAGTGTPTSSATDLAKPSMSRHVSGVSDKSGAGSGPALPRSGSSVPGSFAGE